MANRQNTSDTPAQQMVQKFREETLLPYLKTNYLLLQGHISNTQLIVDALQGFC